MSTALTTLVQDHRDVDVHVLFNVGNGERATDGYAEYRRLTVAGARPDQRLERTSYDAYDGAARARGINSKLSDFDERVRRVAALRVPNVRTMELENDHALDSGAWLKFIRSGRWRDYERVLFLQEGTLLTRPTVLGAMLDFAETHDAHMIAGGHYKDRVSKSEFMRHNTRGARPLPIDVFHDRMIRETFDIFARDPEFAALLERWPADDPTTQQNHVPDIWGPSWRVRLRNAMHSRAPLPDAQPRRAAASALRALRPVMPRLGMHAARARVWAADRLGLGGPRPARASDRIHVDGTLRPVSSIVEPVVVRDVRFHREEAPEWHGCCCNHMFSRRFLTDLHDRLEKYSIYDVLDLPFAGTGLELIWGFMPAWLGYDKWFTDGLHRVIKQFAALRREDEPAQVAQYINRYFRGRLAVGWDGDFLKVRAARRADLARLRATLDEAYF
jgi:hypothetical protein